MSCPVHPHSTGGEVLTIGFILREGETNEQRYAEWATRRGESCVCDVVVVSGDHRFWFPKTDSRLGRCRGCKLIVTRQESEKRKFGPCIKPEASHG